MSIVFLFDENPDVASAGLDGEWTDRMSSYLSGSLSVTNSTAGSCSKNKNGLPEGLSIPHRRCPRGQLGGGGGSGPVLPAPALQNVWRRIHDRFWSCYECLNRSTTEEKRRPIAS